MVAQTQILFFQAERQQEIAAERAPIAEPFEVGVRLAEKFKLHLFEFAHTENEVAGRDLIAEGFADLTDAERQLAARGALDVGKVDENALCCFGTEVNGVLRVLGNALEGLEHEVEFADIREIVLAAARAGNVMLFDEILHFLFGERIDRLFKRKAGFAAPVLDDFVGAETLMAFAAVH